MLLLDRVTRQFAGAARPVLDGCSLELARGEAVAITGRSGSGKSTLLHLAAGIDVPTAGHVIADGVDLASLGDAARTRWRRDTVGLVFQFFHLLPHLTVAENVALPGYIAATPGRERDARVAHLLDRVGLRDRAGDPTGVLSGGEQQRVAICRALLHRPALVLADEPTGNLDDDTAATILDLLLAMVHEDGAALLAVTHSAETAARADRVLHLHGGRLEPA